MKHRGRKTNLRAKHLILLLGLLIYFNSCTFDPFKEYISPITPPNPIEVIFTVDDPAFKDPYYVFDFTRIHFQMEGIPNSILHNEVKANGSTITSYVENNGISFILNPYELGTGNHTIEMTIYLDTRSGSLANRFGAEFYEIKQAFTAIVDPTPPEFNSFTASMKNGYLTLDWNKTSKKNFVYMISRTGHYLTIPDSTIKDTGVNSFVDSGYVGGMIFYKVTAVGFGFQKTVGEGSFDHLSCDFDVIRDEDGTVRLIWSQSYINTHNLGVNIQTSKNFEKYIYKPISPSGNIIIDKLKSTEELFVNVHLFRKGYTSNTVSFSWHVSSVPNIKPFLQYKMLKKSNGLLIADHERVYRYNLIGIQLEGSLSLIDNHIESFQSFTISSDESIGYASGHIGSLISFEPKSFAAVEHHDIAAITQSHSNLPIYSMRLGNTSNSGLLGLSFYRGNYYSMVIDIKNKKILWISAPGSTYFPPVLSKDGNLFAVNLAEPNAGFEGWVFKRSGDNFEALGKIVYGKHEFVENDSEIISYNKIDSYADIYAEIELKMIVYDLLNQPQEPSESLLIKREKELPKYLDEHNLINFIDFDACTNNLVLRYDATFKLLDISTLNFGPTINDAHNAYYSNNYILRHTGFLELIK